MPSSLNLESLSKNADFISKWNIDDEIWEDSLIISTDTSLESVLDGDPIIKYLKGLTIDSNCTLTVSNRCEGIVLFIYGDVNINGTLTMTKRGAKASGNNLAIDHINAKLLIDPDDWTSYPYSISKTGGSGGVQILINAIAYQNTSRQGYSGAAGINSCGGGGGGGCCCGPNGSATSGGGTAGTSWSGGSGGGGINSTGVTLAASSGVAGGGSGGYGQGYDSGSLIRGGGGGAGNPGAFGVKDGVNNTGFSGETGTGGLIILVVKGSINISSTGLISSNGGNGGTPTGCNGSSGGGASGGGCITILYDTDYINNGTIQANGGAGGTGSNANGGAGGAGSIRTAKVSI